MPKRIESIVETTELHLPGFDGPFHLHYGCAAMGRIKEELGVSVLRTSILTTLDEESLPIVIHAGIIDEERDDTTPEEIAEVLELRHLKGALETVVSAINKSMTDPKAPRTETPTDSAPGE